MIALGRTDGIGGNQHAFEHAVRIAFEHAAIHERAGIAFVGIADDIFLLPDVALETVLHFNPVG